MNQLAANASTATARAALWSWNGATGVLTIRAEPGGAFSSMDGAWSLEALLSQLLAEGFQRFHPLHLERQVVLAQHERDQLVVDLGIFQVQDADGGG